MSCSIASALRSLKPDVKVYAAEVETGAPLAASLAAGEPVEVKHTPSFVDGISAPVVFPGMFPLASLLLDGSLVATLDEVASAIRVVAERNHVIAEGAGATSVAAALAGKAGSGKVVASCPGATSTRTSWRAYFKDIPHSLLGVCLCIPWRMKSAHEADRDQRIDDERICPAKVVCQGT